jgi:hypothetical protein
MGTPIGSTTVTHPSVKLRNIGDSVDVALVDSEIVSWTEFSGPNKGKQKIGNDGRPRTQDRVTAVVIRGTGVVTVDDVDRPVEPDEVVTIYFAGHRRWEFINAQRAVKDGMQCGDIMRVKYARDEPSSQGGDPKKVWDVQIRHPKPEEQALADRCEQLRTAGEQAGRTPIGEPEPAWDDDEEPF